AMVDIQGQAPDQYNERFETVLAAALEYGLASDVLLSNSVREFQTLWAILDGINGFLTACGQNAGYDISVPPCRWIRC
ncbi:FAD-binding oxidoreductase, partial [Rhizobium leguminosarum]